MIGNIIINGTVWTSTKHPTVFALRNSVNITSKLLTDMKTSVK